MYVTVKDLLTNIPTPLPPVQHCSCLQVNFYHSLSLKLMVFTEAFNSMQVLTLIQREQESRGSIIGKAPCYLSVEKEMETACNTSKLNGALKTFSLLFSLHFKHRHTQGSHVRTDFQCSAKLPYLTKIIFFLAQAFHLVPQGNII